MHIHQIQVGHAGGITRRLWLQMLFPQGARTLLPESGGKPSTGRCCHSFIYSFIQSTNISRTLLTLICRWSQPLSSVTLPPGQDAHPPTGRTPPCRAAPAAQLEATPWQGKASCEVFPRHPRGEESLGSWQALPARVGITWSRRGGVWSQPVSW